MLNKKVIFVIKCMTGGGAERVLSLIASVVAEKDIDVKILLTHQKLAEADIRDVETKNGIEIISVSDNAKETFVGSILKKVLLFVVRIMLKIGMKFSDKIYDKALVLKYFYNNFDKIFWMKRYLAKSKKATIVAFLYDSMYYSLLAKKRSNKLIISERADPCQYLHHRTNRAFILNEFEKADAFVFQSPDVKKWYEANTGVRGTVIFNPIKADLPEPFFGERKKCIVNFCRINPQKNIPLLLSAFDKFSESVPGYELHIYGDASSEADIEYYNISVEIKNSLPCAEKIHFFSARKDIHNVIRDYAMFVSSSDFEGMSNSMLEAMAIGLPCVCTDCPAGGARAVINDGENGLLVPVNDAKALGDAMIKVVSEQGLSEKLSLNSRLIKNTQSLEKITEKWMDIIL